MFRCHVANSFSDWEVRETAVPCLASLPTGEKGRSVDSPMQSECYTMWNLYPHSVERKLSSVCLPECNRGEKTPKQTSGHQYDARHSAEEFTDFGALAACGDGAAVA